MRKCTISNLGTIVTGKTPSTKNENYWGNEIPFVTPKDIQSSKHIFNTERYLTTSGANSVKGCILPPKSICVSCIGNIGYTSMTIGRAVSNQQINSIIVNNEHDIDFVYYLMKSLWSYFKNYEGQSTTVSILNKSQFSKIEILIPDNVNIERKISAILSSIDNKIELNQQQNNNLEQQAQALFDEYFPSVSTGEINIGKYISPKRGKNLLSKDAVSGKVPVVAGGLSPSTYHNTANTTSPVITISASGANAGYVNLWHIPVWSSDSSFIDSKMTPYVYFWFIMLKKRQKEIFDSQTGSAQPHIYPQHIEVMPISELDMERVKKYNNEITPMFNLIGRNIEENTRLAQLRDTLLPKFMSGEIDVSNMDISALTSTDKLSFILLFIQSDQAEVTSDQPEFFIPPYNPCVYWGLGYTRPARIFLFH